MAEKSGGGRQYMISIVVKSSTYVKSPVASGSFDCSSVRNLVSVMMSVLIASSWALTPLVAMLTMLEVYVESTKEGGKREKSIC